MTDKIVFDNILEEIEQSTLTDIEYGTISTMDTSTDELIFTALASVLVARGGVGESLTRLSSLALARGIAYNAPDNSGFSNVCLGVPLD